jgi:hypothetical protein
MQVNVVRVYNYTDFDFDALYDGSEPDIHKNYFWQGEPGGRSKKEMLSSFIESDFSLGVSKDNEPLFAFKITIDGIDHLVNIGYIEADGVTYRSRWLLAKAYNGSKSFIFDTNTTAIRAQFFQDNNLTGYKMETRTNTIMYQAVTNKTTVNVVEDQREGDIGAVLKIWHYE